MFSYQYSLDNLLENHRGRVYRSNKTFSHLFHTWAPHSSHDKLLFNQICLFEGTVPRLLDFLNVNKGLEKTVE